MLILWNATVYEIPNNKSQIPYCDWNLGFLFIWNLSLLCECSVSSQKSQAPMELGISLYLEFITAMRVVH